MNTYTATVYGTHGRMQASYMCADASAAAHAVAIDASRRFCVDGAVVVVECGKAKARFSVDGLELKAL